MSGLYLKHEGTWKLPKAVYANKSGTWKPCKGVFVKANGEWLNMISVNTLTANQTNFNLWKHVGSPTEPLVLTFNINAGVEVTSSDTETDVNPTKRTTALTVGNFPVGSTVVINNNGYISGGGGFGGRGYFYARYTASNGGGGGDAIVKGSTNVFDCTIVNTGTIAAGGGGGGGGVGYTVPGRPFMNPTVVPGNTGGQGAGITGYSRTEGGPKPTPAEAKGGAGGNLGEDGEIGDVNNINAGEGGDKGIAVGAGIEIAVSGNIIGVVK